MQNTQKRLRKRAEASNLKVLSQPSVTANNKTTTSSNGQPAIVEAAEVEAEDGSKRTFLSRVIKRLFI